MLADWVAGVLVQGLGPGSSLRLAEAGLPPTLEGLMPPLKALSALPPGLKLAPQSVWEVAPV